MNIIWNVSFFVENQENIKNENGHCYVSDSWCKPALFQDKVTLHDTEYDR